jgi:hypothetical protein
VAGDEEVEEDGTGGAGLGTLTAKSSRSISKKRQQANVIHQVAMRWFSALRHPRSSLSQSVVENTTVWACDRKVGLHRAYQVATAEYARTVEVLTNRMGALTNDEYDLLRQFVEDARNRSELARDVLDRHIVEHGC